MPCSHIEMVGKTGTVKLRLGDAKSTIMVKPAVNLEPETTRDMPSITKGRKEKGLELQALASGDEDAMDMLLFQELTPDAFAE
jgi:hypothetical protein